MDFALNSPTVMGKVAELTPLLPQVPTKELHGIFQTIVEKVFGLQSGGRGWDIAATLRTSHPRFFLPLVDANAIFFLEYILQIDQYISQGIHLDCLVPSD